MVPVRVIGVALDSGMQPVVLLTPIDEGDGPRVLVPIWVGTQEAASISVAVSGETPPRPLSHDLMQQLLDVVGAAVAQVEITRLDEGTFYAELRLSTPAGAVTLDCRPSDAIALASRTGAPLFIAEAVLADAGVLDQPDDVPDPDAPVDPETAEEEVAEFREFLRDVDPEDFQG